MESGKDAALQELQQALSAKYAFAPGALRIIEREVAVFGQRHRQIQVKDIGALESSIAKELKKNAEELKLEDTKLSPSPHSKPTIPGAVKQLFSTDCLPAVSQSPTSLNRSVPTVPSIVPVVSGKRRPQALNPTVLFPRADGSVLYIRRSPDREKGGLSPLDLGVADEERFRRSSTGLRRPRTKRDDSWSKVVRWDTAKYLQEQEARKSAELLRKKQYQLELDKQRAEKEQLRASEYAEITQAKAESAQTQQLLAEEKHHQLISKAASAATQLSTLKAITATSQEFRLRRIQEKAAERRNIDSVVKQKLLEKEVKDNERKAALAKVQHLHEEIAVWKRAEEQSRRAEAQYREKLRIAQDLQRYAENERRKCEEKRLRDKSIACENLTAAEQKRQKVPTEQCNLSPPRLFLDADLRRAAVSKQQEETNEYLAQQRTQTTADTPACKSAADQCFLLPSEKQVGADKAAQKRQKQVTLRQALDSQVEAKSQQLWAEMSFSRHEQMLNKALIDAVNAFPR